MHIPEQEYFDNAVLRVSGYRGTTITNSMFNGGSRLELAPSLRPGTPSASDPNCQYWKGAVCSLNVRGNQFLCGKMGCAGVDVGYAFAQAAAVYVGDNSFEDSAENATTHSSTVTGAMTTMDSAHAWAGRSDPDRTTQSADSESPMADADATAYTWNMLTTAGGHDSGKLAAPAEMTALSRLEQLDVSHSVEILPSAISASVSGRTGLYLRCAHRFGLSSTVGNATR